MLKRQRRITLCQHIKKDGNICRSPALRKRRFCRAHAEQRRRELRMARARSVALIRAEALQQRAAALQEQMVVALICAPLMHFPSIKNLALNYFDETTLRETFGLNPDGSRL